MDRLFKNLVACVTIAALGLGAGYFLGAANYGGRAPSLLKPPLPQAQPQTEPFDYTPPALQTSVQEAIGHRKSHYVDFKSVADALDLPTPFARTEALYVIAGRADAQQLQVLIREAMGVAHRYQRTDALKTLFVRYVELSPPAALAFLQSLDLDTFDIIAEALFEAWAKQDLAGALSACNGLNNARVRATSGYMILATVARNDPGMLDAAQSRLSGHHDTSYIRSEAIGIVANFRPLDALQQAQEISNKWGRRDAARRVGTVWARNDPAAAFAQANRLDDDMRGAYVDAVLKRWLEDDTQTALDALLSLPESKDKDNYLKAGLKAYALIDPGSALRLVDSLAPETHQQSYKDIFLAWSRTDPDRALATLVNLGNRPLRDSTLAWVIGDVTKSYPDLALRHVQTLDDDARAALMPKILRPLAESDPQRAIELARRSAGQAEREQALSVVLQQIVRTHPRLAASNISELSDGPFSQNLYRQVATAMAADDPAAALAWAGSLPDDTYDATVGALGSAVVATDPDLAASLLGQVRESAREKWITGVAKAYAETDPRRALSWISQYKDSAVYDSALVTVSHLLAQVDPKAALRALEALPAETGGQGVRRALKQWTENDPQAAARYAAGMDDSVRLDAVTAVVGSWSSEDPDSAEAWALTLGSDERDRALMVIASNARGSVQRQARLINAMSSEPRREKIAFFMYESTRKLQGEEQADALLRALDISNEERAKLRDSRL